VGSKEIEKKQQPFEFAQEENLVYPEIMVEPEESVDQQLN
jgi:hypothetical protein